MKELELIKLEKTIRSKMQDIRSKKISVKDSNIGSSINLLKKVDIASYEKVLSEYKNLLKSL